MGRWATGSGAVGGGADAGPEGRGAVVDGREPVHRAVGGEGQAVREGGGGPARRRCCMALGNGIRHPQGYNPPSTPSTKQEMGPGERGGGAEFLLRGEGGGPGVGVSGSPPPPVGVPSFGRCRKKMFGANRESQHERNHQQTTIATLNSTMKAPGLFRTSPMAKRPQLQPSPQTKLQAFGMTECEASVSAGRAMAVAGAAVLHS